MNIYYFGADKPWHELKKTGFRRRNTCLLKAFAESNLTENIYVVRKVSRKEYLLHLFSKEKIKYEKVKDIVFTTFLPEKLLINKSLVLLNKKISAMLLRYKSGPEKEDDIIWGYWPQGFKTALDSGLDGTLVFDADHNIIDDPNISEKEKPDRAHLLLEIGKQADYIVSSVRSMIDWYMENGITKGIRLRNGVEPDRFNNNHNSLTITHAFTVGYCGTLSKWIDYDVFSELAKRNPDWEFVVIGKPFLNDDWEKLQQVPNIKLLGEKPADEVASLLPSFNAAINLYKAHPALDVDSMKLYEYIAAGVPVVSTSFHPHLKEDFHNILYLGDSVEEVESHLTKIKNNGIAPNQTIVHDFLQQSNWLSRANRFIESIS